MSFPSTTRRSILAVAGSCAAGLLVGCSEDTSAPQPSQASASKSDKWEKLRSSANGFDAGLRFSTRRAFVFFDPQCPHCSKFWLATKPLASAAQLTWVPVGLLGALSLKQGAMILGASDPVTAMNEHEMAFTSAGYRGGIRVENLDEAALARVKANTELFDSLGFNGVPFVVGRNARSGEVFTRQAGMSAEVLLTQLGGEFAS